MSYLLKKLNWQNATGLAPTHEHECKRVSGVNEDGRYSIIFFKTDYGIYDCFEFRYASLVDQLDEEYVNSPDFRKMLDLSQTCDYSVFESTMQILMIKHPVSPLAKDPNTYPNEMVTEYHKLGQGSTLFGIAVSSLNHAQLVATIGWMGEHLRDMQSSQMSKPNFTRRPLHHLDTHQENA